MQISAKFSRNSICISGSPTVERADLEPVTKAGQRRRSSLEIDGRRVYLVASAVLALYEYRAKMVQITHTARKA